jgi:hypothetical protein
VNTLVHNLKCIGVIDLVRIGDQWAQSKGYRVSTFRYWGQGSFVKSEYVKGSKFL